MLLQVVESELVGFVQMLVELVEFHEHAAVVAVELESLFHVFHGLQTANRRFRLVKACQGEIAPYGGKHGVELGRQFPIAYGEVVLPLVVVEAAEVIRCACTVGVDGFGGFQGQNVLQPVGEAVVGLHGLCLGEEGFCLVLCLHGCECVCSCVLALHGLRGA